MHCCGIKGRGDVLRGAELVPMRCKVVSWVSGQVPKSIGMEGSSPPSRTLVGRAAVLAVCV